MPYPLKALRNSRLCLTTAAGLVIISSVWPQDRNDTRDPSVPTEAEVRKTNPVRAKPDDILELSPFNVTTDKDAGYYAENTLAGSRLKTRVSDLAASITVVTKQQMEDTGSIDLNDMFRYEANTEGSATYTPAVQSARNDGVADTNSGLTLGADGVPQTNATSNRIRGLGIPSSSINFYPSIGQLPVDSYNVQSLEISRGPNSLLFGLGSPSGVVNQSTTQAVLDRNRAQAIFRVDDRGSTRESLSFNASILPHKLALYGAVLDSHAEFVRKPSYDKTEREFGAITFKPFRKTILRGSFENYHNRNNRPNSLTPIDGTTQWRLAGEPVYNPSTLMVTKLLTGQQIGPFVLQSTSPLLDQTRSFIMAQSNYNPALFNAAKTTYNGVNIFGTGALNNIASPLYVPGLNFIGGSRTLYQVANGQLVNWLAINAGTYRTQFGTATDPAANAPLIPTEATIYTNSADTLAYSENWSATVPWTAGTGNVGSYRYPGVSDKSIYDWSKVNVLQANFGEDKNKTYNLEFEQEILPDLNLSAGWFRQEFTSLTSYTISQSNAAVLTIDTNVNLPNGNPNPFFGQPYVTDTGADRFINTEVNNNYRALLAYTPDFTRYHGWVSWLGHHQLLGLFSRQNDMKSLRRRHLYFTDSGEVANGTIRWLKNPNNNADGSPTGWNYENSDQIRDFYLSTPGHQPYGTVTRGSGNWDETSFSGNVQTYNFGLHKWEPVSATQKYIDSSATTGRNQRQLDTWSTGITSYLWDDRLVFTGGLRRDEYKGRITTTGAILDQSGNQIAPALTSQEKWVNGIFQTDRVFNRWKPFDKLSGNTSTEGAVFRPFRGYRSIDNRASNSALWELVQNLGLSYNNSDNFNPPPSAQVDGFGHPLPKPTGTGEDWGVQTAVFHNKLFARLNFFRSDNVDERTNAVTAFGRLTGSIDDTDFKTWARTIAEINLGMDPTVSGFDTNLPQATEDAVERAAEKIYGLPYTYYSTVGTIGATRTAAAKGAELQLTYNPIKNWTIKVTGGRQKTVYTNVLKEFDAYYAYRYPIWAAAKASNYLSPQYQQFATYNSPSGTPVNLTNFLTSYGYGSAPKLGDAQGVDNVQKQYDSIVAPQYAIARDLQGQAAPGQREYRGSLLTNYTFAEGWLKDVGIGGSVRWESRAIIGYYGKSSGANANPLFVDVSDTNRPIYDKGNTYADVWLSYSRRLFSDKIRMKIQLNVVDVPESGRLQKVAVNYDGSPSAYRIVDPRQFILTTSFDF